MRIVLLKWKSVAYSPLTHYLMSISYYYASVLLSVSCLQTQWREKNTSCRTDRVYSFYCQSYLEIHCSLVTMKGGCQAEALQVVKWALIAGKTTTDWKLFCLFFFFFLHGCSHNFCWLVKRSRLKTISVTLPSQHAVCQLSGALRQGLPSLVLHISQVCRKNFISRGKPKWNKRLFLPHQWDSNWAWVA